MSIRILTEMPIFLFNIMKIQKFVKADVRLPAAPAGQGILHRDRSMH